MEPPKDVSHLKQMLETFRSKAEAESPLPAEIFVLREKWWLLGLSSSAPRRFPLCAPSLFSFLPSHGLCPLHFGEPLKVCEPYCSLLGLRVTRRGSPSRLSVALGPLPRRSLCCRDLERASWIRAMLELFLGSPASCTPGWMATPSS